MRLGLAILLFFTSTVSAVPNSFQPGPWVKQCLAQFESLPDIGGSLYFATRCADWPGGMCLYVEDPERCITELKTELEHQTNRMMQEVSPRFEAPLEQFDGLRDQYVRIKTNAYDELCDGAMKSKYEIEEPYYFGAISFEDHCSLSNAVLRLNELMFLRNEVELIERADDGK